VKRRVVITGLGVVAPNGVGVRPFLRAIQDGRSGIKRVTTFDTAGMRARIGGEVRGRKGLLPGVDRFGQLALLAAREAVAGSGLSAGHWGISVGTLGGGILSLEQAIISGKRPKNLPSLAYPGAAAILLAKQLKLTGRQITVANSCAAGTTALAFGAEMIRRGEYDVVLAGGCESFNLLTFAGFHALRSLDPFCCRPFDAQRQGLVVGEGAAFMVLEEAEHACRRGAEIWGEIAGYGLASDAYHETAPEPSGRGAARALTRALADSRLDKTAIDYYNAHGTGTLQNDAMETRALKKVFGPHAYDLPVSSLKSMIGHLMGAAGAVEAAASILALRYSFIPPTINYQKRDPVCDLDYVPNRARSKKLAAVLSANFGFGGSNAAIAFKKYD
jgi:3-oxoacyl-[acyl-carrier-protein] synthase II